MALTDNIVSYWKFDEASGNAADSAGVNTLTNNNVVTYTAAAGIINNGANFVRASSQFFSIPDASQSGLDITGDLSVSMWVKPTSTTLGGTGRLISKYDTANNGAYLISIGGSSPGDVHVLTSSDGTTQQQGSITPSPAFVAGTKYHLVLVYTAASANCKVYIQGSLNGTITGLATSLFNSSAPFQVAQRSSGSAGEYYDGGMDEIGIWSRVLTSGEVTSLYNSGAGLQYPFSASSPKNRVNSLLSLLGVGS